MNTFSPSISIIVTIFNAGNYIQECIENILGQSYSNFELLLIDDGSTDTSGTICEEYAKKDKRIRVFHEQHKGVAHARQIGIDNAKGEYFIYIDADDYIEENFIEEMFLCARSTNSDIVICDYLELKKDNTIYHKEQPTELSGISYLNDILANKCYGALWNKMILTQLVKDHNARFPQDFSMREDVVFISQFVPQARKLSYIPKALYIYNRQNVSSLTNNYLDESKNYYLHEIKWIITILKNSFLYEETKHKNERYLLELAYITLRSDLLSKEDWKTFFVPYAQRMKLVGTGYKKALVLHALNGHFTIARIIRTIISKIK